MTRPTKKKDGDRVLAAQVTEKAWRLIRLQAAREGIGVGEMAGILLERACLKIAP